MPNIPAVFVVVSFWSLLYLVDFVLKVIVESSVFLLHLVQVLAFQTLAHLTFVEISTVVTDIQGAIRREWPVIPFWPHQVVYN